MHIPDGYLGPITYGSLWGSIIPVWIYASKKIKEAMKASQIPFLAIASAFSFIIMMFNVPIPGGTTGHVTGATLIAILIGPWAATLALSISLIIQAFVFGDGGITAIGANCFNIAFAGAFVGYGVYRVISWARGKVQANPPSPPFRKGGMGGFELRTRHLIGAGIGAYIGINISALLASIELGIQPMLHTGLDGRPLYSPFPLSITIPAIMIGNLLIFGIIEAVVTILVLIYLKKSHPELIRG